MIRAFHITSIVLIGLCLFQAPVSAGEGFRFAVFCDARARVDLEKCTGEKDAFSPVLDVVIRHVLEKNAASPVRLVLFPGDMIPGYHGVKCNEEQLTAWTKRMAPLTDAGMMLRVTSGNHDIGVVDRSVPPARCGRHTWGQIPNKEAFDAFKRVMKDFLGDRTGPESDLGATYSFETHGCHFAVLAAYTMFENNSFSKETLAWLDKDLSEARSRNLNLFVLSHPPAFPGGGHTWDSLPFYDPSFNCDNYSGIDRRKERDRFWNILKKHGVTAYLCGHEHNTQVQLVEGVWQVIAGGLTAKLYPLNGSATDPWRNTILYDGEYQNPRASIAWPWDEDPKSYYGWTLVNVTDERITLDVFGSETLPKETSDLKPLKSFVLKEFSPRGSTGAEGRK